VADEMLLKRAVMNISFKTKIRYNGQEFSSVDQLPPDIRAIYERALANKGKSMSTGTKVSTRLVVNGREVGSTDEMSEAEQKLYADVMQLVKEGATKDLGPTTAQSATITKSLPEAPNVSMTTPGSVPSETGWLTANQKKLVAVVAGLILIAVLAIAVRLLS
jgi:hypothetical protein